MIGVVKVDAGNSVDIDCDSYGETSWYFKSNYFKFEYIPVRGKTLTLQSITPDNAGRYICYGRYRPNIFAYDRVFQETHLKVFSKLFLHTLRRRQINNFE